MNAFVFYCILWSRQESNLYLKFRKLLFYPLNYETKIGIQSWTIDDCGVCTGGKTTNKPCTEFMEAENACLVDGIQLESINGGYSGAGYVNTDNEIGATITWSLNSTIAQTATLSFRFANGEVLQEMVVYK
jgi:hypothetical protein